MSYYQGSLRGDYYRGRRGDPFSLGGIIKGIGGFLTGGPIGAVGALLGGSGTPSYPGVGLMAGGPKKPEPGLTGVVHRLLPGGKTGYIGGRRMNVTNSKALRRAIRRVSGFGKLVQRSKRAIARANSAVGNKHRTVARRGRR